MLCGFVVSRLQCLQLSLRTRFPFHDSQVLSWSWKSPQERPKRRPRGPKSAKRPARDAKDSATRRQESAKRRQDAPKSDFGSHLGSILDPPGTPKPSKTIEKTRVLKNFVFFQRRRKKRPKELPKEAPGKPKCLPGAPRERPGAAQEAQRQRQERPRATQERPKSRPRGEQKEQKRLQLSFPLLGWAREASGSHFEAIWERFGSLRGGILEPFSRLFLCFKRSVAPARARGVPSDTPPRR